MKTHSRYDIGRKCLIFWCLFIGIGAVGGAVGMLSKLDGSNMGMQDLLPFFQVLPLAKYLYQDFLFPGIALLCVNGITNLTASVLLLKRKKAGIICGGIFGLTLMAWISIQFVIFPANFMSTTYFIFGIIQALTGFATWVFYTQEHFVIKASDYTNIGTDPSTLVVYFSRMGYTKKKAYERANLTGAKLYEIKAKERTEGTLGFWWCGRFGMHNWAMDIQEIELDLASYQTVTICSPVWVFNLSGPIKSFCQFAKGKVTNVNYILTHFNCFKYKRVVNELNNRLALKATSVDSYCIKWGKEVKHFKF